MAAEPMKLTPARLAAIIAAEERDFKTSVPAIARMVIRQDEAEAVAERLVASHESEVERLELVQYFRDIARSVERSYRKYDGARAREYGATRFLTASGVGPAEAHSAQDPTEPPTPGASLPDEDAD